MITTGIRTRPQKLALATQVTVVIRQQTLFFACQKINDVLNSNTVAREEFKKEKGEFSLE